MKLGVLILLCLCLLPICASFVRALEKEEDPEWVRELKIRAEKLEGRQREFAFWLLSNRGFGAIIVEQGKFDDSLKPLVGWRGDMPFDEIMRRDGDMFKTVAALVGEENAELAKRIWEREKEYSFCGRSLYGNLIMVARRSGKLAYHFNKNVEIVRDFVFAVAQGFYADAYLRGNLSEELWDYVRASRFFPPLLGLLLDEHDPDGKLFEAVKESFEKNTTRTYTGYPPLLGHLAASLFACHRPEAHEFVAEMTYKHSITEEQHIDILQEANQWTLEGFISFLKNADRWEIGLPTGSSAFSRWVWNDEDYVGIGTCKWGGHPASALRELERENPWDGLYSGRASEVLLALWALMQKDVDAAREACLTVIGTGTQGQKMTALYFSPTLGMSNSGILALKNEEDRNDDAFFGMAVRCLSRFTPDTLEERRLLYDWMADATEKMIASGGKERGALARFGDHAMPIPIVYQQSELLNLMLVAAARKDFKPWVSEPDPVLAYWGIKGRLARLPKPRLPDELDGDAFAPNIRDDVCRFMPHMNQEQTEDLVRAIDADQGVVQRRTIFAAMDKAPLDVYDALAGTEIADDEYRELEAFLSGEEDEVRRAVLALLLRRDAVGLGVSVRRLIADEDSLRRKAGFELLAIMAKRRQADAYHDIFRECDRIARAAPEAERYVELLDAYAVGDYGLCAP